MNVIRLMHPESPYGRAISSRKVFVFTSREKNRTEKNSTKKKVKLEIRTKATLTEFKK